MRATELSRPLSDAELDELGQFLARVEKGAIPNVEILDGFLTALVICPELAMPSEYMPVILSGETEAGDLVFETLVDARRVVGTQIAVECSKVSHVGSSLAAGSDRKPTFARVVSVAFVPGDKSRRASSCVSTTLSIAVEPDEGLFHIRRMNTFREPDAKTVRARRMTAPLVALSRSVQLMGA